METTTETTTTFVQVMALVNLVVFILFICLLVLCILALIKYISTKDVRKEKSTVKKALGETIKMHRTNCHMTQEFVASSLGVSRQAVSKWEKGVSDPSTSNLLALANLFHISPEELLKDVSVS